MMLRLIARESLRRWQRQPSILTSRPLVTSRQKRALKEAEIKGAATHPPPPVSSAATGGSSSVAPVAVVALGLLGSAGAYYYYTTTLVVDGSSETTTASKSVVSTTEVSEKRSAEKAAPAIQEDKKTKETAKNITKPTGEEKETQSGAGNRVTKIPVSSKMQNAQAKSAVEGASPDDEEHPASGHRVTTLVPKSNTNEPIDTSMTDAAIAALQKETSETTAKTLLDSHSTLALSMIQDLESMDDVTQLKAKILQLSSELQDRTKWEAVRLKEFLVMKEKEVAEKYLEIVQKQRLEMEDIMAKRLREQEYALSNTGQKALQEKENNIQSVIEAALAAQEAEHEADKKAYQEIVTAEVKANLADQFAQEMDEIRKQNAARIEEKTTILKELSAKLKHLELALSASQANKEGSLKAHRLSAAALALSEKLETNESAATELAVLSKAAGSEGVIATACATIPKSVNTGVPTVAELQARFDKVAKKCRQSLLVPQGELGLEGQLAGMVMAAVTYPPTDKGDTSEHKLEQARELVAQGSLEEAISKLETLSGQANFVARDWKQAAIERIAVEKALKVIKMECALLNESCLEDSSSP